MLEWRCISRCNDVKTLKWCPHNVIQTSCTGWGTGGCSHDNQRPCNIVIAKSLKRIWRKTNRDKSYLFYSNENIRDFYTKRMEWLWNLELYCLTDRILGLYMMLFIIESPPPVDKKIVHLNQNNLSEAEGVLFFVEYPFLLPGATSNFPERCKKKM